MPINNSEVHFPPAVIYESLSVSVVVSGDRRTPDRTSDRVLGSQTATLALSTPKALSPLLIPFFCMGGRVEKEWKEVEYNMCGREEGELERERKKEVSQRGKGGRGKSAGKRTQGEEGGEGG